jgi:MFS family permease
MIGTVVEYFDFLIYSTVSGLVFRDLFFPVGNQFVASMLVWTTFAVGFLARPIGGIIFGHLGDRIGRTKVLFVTLIMMGLATTVIGLLPTYAQIGVAAPVILVLLRVIQGLGVGGEYGGAAVLVIEHTEGSGRRGLYGALTSASSGVGFLLGSGLMALLTFVTTPGQFSGWAWRIPFLLSVVFLAVGFYIRRRIGETPAMRKAIEERETVRVPLFELFRHNARSLAVSLGAPLGLFAAYYVIITFTVPYAVQHGVGNESFLLAMTTIAQVIYVASIVFGGWLSDKRSRRFPILLGSVVLAVWIFVFFPLVLTGTVAGVLVGFVVALLGVGMIFGPMAAFLSELFGTGVRFSGLSFGYQVSAAVAGGLTPVLGTYLIHATGTWVPLAGLIAAALVITFLAVLASQDRANTVLLGTTVEGQ